MKSGIKRGPRTRGLKRVRQREALEAQLIAISMALACSRHPCALIAQHPVAAPAQVRDWRL